MKLLICTQIVDQNDPVLGFFHEWLLEFAKHCETVTVICLQEGKHVLPANVTVHSLGKEQGVGRLARAWRALKLFSSLRSEYDTVFVHMNPEYALLGGLLWRVWGKTIALWYVHKSVNLRLRLAVLLVNHVFTASKESFRLHSRKVHVVGHGINLSLFTPHGEPNGDLRIVTVGRISPTKRPMDILPALDLLFARGRQFTFTVVGAPVTARDQLYERSFKEEISKRPYVTAVTFVGSVPYRDIPQLFNQATVNINLSETGSLDKAVLDGFAAGVPAVSSNVAFKEILQPHGLFVPNISPLTLVEAIEKAAQASGVPFRGYVAAHHSLSGLIPRMLEILK
ncbi:glycosyltransferase family 4 protein [Candidatus Parcubacteria bacterium]|nr:glycosyltransferase family 4 protein [Candidatus Parcubacteria bacterium]